MRRFRSSFVRAGLVAGLAVSAPPVQGQAPAPEDANIQPVRRMTQIGPADQRLINEWIQAQVDRLAAVEPDKVEGVYAGYRKKFSDLYRHADNSPQFRTQFTVQLAELAVGQFAKRDHSALVARTLARVLVDINRAETVPALIAGLRSGDQATRYLCANGLAALRGAIAGDKETLDKVVTALRAAGVAETNPVALGQIYVALTYPMPQATAAAEAVLSILDARVKFRRGPAVVVDRAEVDAYEFFRGAGVLAALTAEQKNRLVAMVAVLLRMDAERYDSPDLAYEEIDAIERRLDGAEAILAEVVGKGGDIRNEIGVGGYERRGEVRRQAYLWVGDAAQNRPGAVNAAPWNVAVGAP